MFEVRKKDSRSRARTGRITTAHGVVETPSYVIVGTHAEVRTLRPEDLVATKTQMVIANTYHLWRTLGDEGLNGYEGLHAAMGWPGPIMTDSGGFQVFSLGFLYDQNMRRGQNGLELEVRGGMKEEPQRRKLVRVTESGVYFHPNLPGELEAEGAEEGEEMYLDAETSIKIQEQLGADIIVAFDEPTAPGQDHEYTKAAMERTHKWAERSLEAKTSDQKMYGVVQGGAFEDLRRESAEFIGNLPFDGFAIGSTYGDAYGGTKAQTADMLDWSVPHLPEGKPRHLFGVGRIEDLFAGVAQGIDTFDCVIPTREARHGGIWTRAGRLDIRKGKFADDDSPLAAECACPVCLDPSTNRGEVRKLFKDKDPQAGRLATIHNVFFFNNLMSEIRQAIEAGNFEEFRKEYLAGLKKQETLTEEA